MLHNLPTPLKPLHMKQLIKFIVNAPLLLVLLGASSMSQAQLTSPALTCGPVFSGSSFTVQFEGQNAKLNLNDELHSLQFLREWITTMGDRWVDYHSPRFIVTTSWPAEPYVAISLPNAKNSMAACDVVEVGKTP